MVDIYLDAWVGGCVGAGEFDEGGGGGAGAGYG